MTHRRQAPGGLTITDVMAAQDGAVESTAWVCLIPGKVGVQDPQFAIEGLLNYAMANG